MSNESGTKRVQGLVYCIFIEGVCCMFIFRMFDARGRCHVIMTLECRVFSKYGS